MLLDAWLNIFGIIDINISLVILVCSLPLIRSDHRPNLGITISVIPIYMIIGVLAGFVLGVLSRVFEFSSIRFSLITLPNIIKVLQISVVEELIFRGLLLGYMRRAGANQFVANVIQTIIFSIGHFDINSLHWESILVVMAFSWIAGLLTMKTKSVRASIIMHFIADLISA